MSIRPVQPSDWRRLTEIAVAAKGSWGYPMELVLDWAESNDFSRTTGAAEFDAFVAEEEGKVVGWGSVVHGGEVAWLEDLWIEPAWMSRGVGTRLFQHARAIARERGARRLEWEAEPNAIEFYKKLGATHIRDSEPTAFGRVAPVMGADVGG